VLLAACSSTPPAKNSNVGPAPTHIVAAPAGLLGITGPQADGSLWVLSGNDSVRTMTKIDAGSGQKLRAIAVSAAATAINQSPNGTLALGISNGDGGAVSFYNGTTGALIGTVPVAQPVPHVVLSLDGQTAYVLQGTPTARSVVLINVKTQAVTATLPLPSDAIDIAPAPDGSSLWVLESGGVIDGYSFANDRIVTTFHVGGDGTVITLSPNGLRLYMLRDLTGLAGTVKADVSVVNLETESQVDALPAPANCVDLAISPDGRTLYDGVGTSTVGNVQAYSVAG
jgi:hypothetical protein